MEQLIEHNKRFVDLYNCSFYDYKTVPFEQRQNLAQGILFLVIGIVEQVRIKFLSTSPLH